jgi:hypothetical protein
MGRGVSCKCLLSGACALILASCAMHKFTPLGIPLSSPRTIGVPVGARPALSEREVPTAQEQSEPGANVEVQRRIASLLEPPRMSLSAGPHAPKEDVPKTDKITFLVIVKNGVFRPESEATIQKALEALASQFLFLCPGRMRVGSAEDCRFATKGGLNDRFRDQLTEQGVSASQAAALTILVQADLTSPNKHAFDIHAEDAASNPTSGQLWRVVPRNPGDHKLELRVALGARIDSAREVHGAPEVLIHSVAVIGGENFLNEYWPAIIGCLAAMALFAWIAWTLWRSARMSAFSNR